MQYATNVEMRKREGKRIKRKERVKQSHVQYLLDYSGYVSLKY